ncbi:MAG: carboxypeptidase M32 [Longimonas sp.]|uniref:carboxypeptidase M32 n=1 Tax=Longimonas sp. TaxID=2039626 RepID=UPI00334DC7D7
MPTSLSDLKDALAPIEDLKSAAAVLSWDQETYMPEGGAEARARQIATLKTMAHERFVTDEVGALLDRAETAVEAGDASAVEADLVRVTQRAYDRARKLPASLVSAFSQAASRGQTAWKQARANDDFDHFAPHLKELVDLTVQKAEALGYDTERYDVLLDEYEPGMPTSTVVDTFADLREELVPIVEAIADQPAPNDAMLHGTFPADAQRAFGEQVIADFGYDFDCGRQDLSAHPFTTSFGIRDVRLTTRFDEAFLPSGLFSTLHEAGHGLYEQGIAPELARTPLAEGASLGIHESQSRLYENMVGRSRPFWQHYYGDLQEVFPEALAGVPGADFYRAINRVEPSLIRVEADEVTYNLHIMLRFELERALVQEDLAVDDLPAAWNDRMASYLGVTPNSDANGVLQDVHWSFGAIGYFPTYALGTLMSAQIDDALRQDLPDLDAQMASGQFDALLQWLRERIHQYGRRLDAPELLKQATGQPLDAGPWLNYVQKKYSAIYPDLQAQRVL